MNLNDIGLIINQCSAELARKKSSFITRENAMSMEEV